MTQKMVDFNDYGVEIRVFNGPVLGKNARKVNVNLAPLMGKLCQWMMLNGYTKLATRGIRNNRLMRAVNKTSRHSDGTSPDFKAWPDGTVGSYGIDIEGFYGPDKELTTRNRKQKAEMVKILEDIDFRIYHKGKINPEHVHAEYKNPTTWM